MNLSELTTLRVGGPAPHVTTVTTREHLIQFCSAHLLDTNDQPGDTSANQPVLFIGGGSNLLISDDGFAGPVCLIRTDGIAQTPADNGRVRVTAEAGVTWDAFVTYTVEAGLSGLEALSGIPGSVGATPVQNVGAYGAEVAELIRSVTLFDRVAGDVRDYQPEDLQFGYRTSLLKTSAAELGQPRYVVLAVEFELEHSDESAPVRYGQLANALGVEIGQTAPLARTREAVLALRASKGMVLNPDDHDTWSAGSFFTNPILPAHPEPGEPRVPEGAPTYPVRNPTTGEVDESVVKTSAAWLIDHAGFDKGFSLNERASLSTKHTLALTNRGDASAADIVELARHIRDGVREVYGISLHPEPNFVGCAL